MALGDVAAFGLGGLRPLPTPGFVSGPARLGLAPVGTATAASPSPHDGWCLSLRPRQRGESCGWGSGGIPGRLGRGHRHAGGQARGEGDTDGRAQHDGPYGATGATGYRRTMGL